MTAIESPSTTAQRGDAAAQWFGVASVVAINAVPLAGVLFFGWSGIVVILLYWAENAIGTAFTAARIVLHRKLTHKRGHWRPCELEGQRIAHSRTLLADYLYSSLLSMLFQGIVVALFAAFALVVLANEHEDWSADRLFSLTQLVHGIASLAVAMALSFAADAWGMRKRSFLWLKVYVAQKHERWMVLFFSVLLGFFAMIPTQSPLAMTYVLIVLNAATGLYHLRIVRRIDSMPLKDWFTEQVRARNRRYGTKQIGPAQQHQIETLLRKAEEDEQTI